jgi:hypothetical protein
MRKKVWGCAVAAAFAALTTSLAIDYACGHPDSWLGRCFFTAQKVAVTESHVMHAARPTAEFAFRGLQGLLGQGTGAVCEDGDNCPAPPAEEECPMPPAVLPGAVVLHLEGDVLPEKPMPPVREGAVEECEEVVMPPAEDGAAKMPRADDDCCCAAPQCKGRHGHCCTPQCKGWPNLQQDGGEKPRHPEVDTMEVRPSDLWFLDLTGPF